MSSALQKFRSENYRNFCWNILVENVNSVKISGNFCCGISAHWKIWEILGGDKALLFGLHNRSYKLTKFGAYFGPHRVNLMVLIISIIIVL